MVYLFFEKTINVDTAQPQLRRNKSKYPESNFVRFKSRQWLFMNVVN